MGGRFDYRTAEAVGREFIEWPFSEMKTAGGEYVDARMTAGGCRRAGFSPWTDLVHDILGGAQQLVDLCVEGVVGGLPYDGCPAVVEVARAMIGIGGDGFTRGRPSEISCRPRYVKNRR